MSTKIPIVIAISVIVTAGIMFSLGLGNQPQITHNPQTEIIYVDKTVSEFFEGTNDVKKIASQEELKEILETSSLLGGNYRNHAMPSVFLAVDEFASAESDMMRAVPTSGVAKMESGGSDYSTTNVQVQNVDESDYLKNDSKYLYIVSQNTLSIIDAYPAELILKN